MRENLRKGGNVDGKMRKEGKEGKMRKGGEGGKD